jgi:Flp pilus assembly pilin Flp
VWVERPTKTEMAKVMHELYGQLRRALGREDGQGATEYGLVLALVLLSLGSTVAILATSITTFVNGVAGAVEALLP